MFSNIYEYNYDYLYKSKNRYYYTKNIKAVKCHFSLVIIALITNLVLLIILGVTYKKGDIDEFNDFLDCRGINKKSFNKFSDVTKLRKYLIIILII